MTIISSVLIADRLLIGVMRMTLDEAIKYAREAAEKYRENASAEPQNSFEVEAKKVAEQEAKKNEQLADWLEELKRYRDLEEQGRLLVLPCGVGDTVYEILEETVPNHYFYISEHKVQDVSMKAVKYADEWEPYDYENLYFTREEAEAALEKRRREK